LFIRSKQMTEILVRDPERTRQVDRLLAAARETLNEVPFCWVMTRALDGGVNARLVKDNTGVAEETPWIRWFLARPDSRKANEIRGDDRVTLAYQHNSGNAYVTLVGRAELIHERSAVELRLRHSDDPVAALAAKLIAVKVTVGRIEIHVRGVTAPPWGHGRTVLQLDRQGVWHMLPD